MKQNLSNIILVLSLSLIFRCSTEKIEEELCSCYSISEQITLDEKLSACLTQYYKENPHLEDPEHNTDEWALDLSITLIHNCQEFYQDMQSMNVERYKMSLPEETILYEIDSLSDEIEKIEYSADTYHRRSSRLVGLEKYEQALSDLNIIIDKNPEDYSAYQAIGYVYEKLGRDEDALEAYQLMEQQNPPKFYSIYKELFLEKMEQKKDSRSQ